MTRLASRDQYRWPVNDGRGSLPAIRELGVRAQLPGDNLRTSRGPDLSQRREGTGRKDAETPTEDGASQRYS